MTSPEPTDIAPQSNAPAPLVSLRGLTVSYADAAAPALAAVDLTVTSGERMAVIGESGSGKSTLALAIAGLLPPGTRVSGTVDWDRPGGYPLPGRDFGFVFQDPAASLDPVLTVGEQIAEAARAGLGLPWAGAFERAAELAARVQLPDPGGILAAYPHQLSGGQKQRVAIAAAIAARPRLLIADEATSALDAIVQAEIVALIRRLVAEDGMALLFVSHDIALASGLAERIAVFHAGRLVELGMAAQVAGAPVDAYTRLLLSAHLPLDGPRLVDRFAAQR